MTTKFKTKRQKDVYFFIKKFIEKHKMSPTEREIAEGIGILSRGVAHRHVEELVKQGLLAKACKGRRKLILIDKYSPCAIIFCISLMLNRCKKDIAGVMTDQEIDEYCYNHDLIQKNKLIKSYES